MKLLYKIFDFLGIFPKYEVIEVWKENKKIYGIYDRRDDILIGWYYGKEKAVRICNFLNNKKP